MLSERPLLLARGDGLAGTVLGEALVVVRPPGPHDELLGGLQKSSGRSLARSEVGCVNEGALMEDEGRWECLLIYEASTRHPGTRSIFLEKMEGGGRNLYVWRNRQRG